jgi:predicted amidohydrolase
MVSKAADIGSRMLFLPENAVFMGRSSTESIAMAESIGDPNGIIRGRIARLAKENDMWISIGGFQEKTEAYPESKVHNCHVLLDNNGEVRATYRKVHLFDVDIETVRLQESSFTLAGSSLVSCENTPIGTIGLSVCYDLRFPEMYQKLRFDHGADVILIPAAFTVPTGQAHWECLLRARAIETQCYVIAAAQCGKHNEKRSSYGHSLIIDPWGEVVGRMEGDEQNDPGLVTAEVDASLIEEVRRRMPVAMHRAKGRESMK